MRNIKFRHGNQLLNKDFPVFLIGVAIHLTLNIVWICFIFPSLYISLPLLAVLNLIFAVLAFISHVFTFLMDPGYVVADGQDNVTVIVDVSTLPNIYPFIPPTTNPIIIDSHDIPNIYPFIPSTIPTSSFDTSLGHVYNRKVSVKGTLIDQKYCTACSLWRPLRASHCNECRGGGTPQGRCVERHDHHCPWTSNCIGRLNYPFFYFFSVAIWVNCGMTFGSSVYFQTQRSFEPGAVVVAVGTGILFWPLTGLVLYHSYLLVFNRTTREEVKRSWDGRANPYDLGVCENIWDVLVKPFFM